MESAEILLEFTPNSFLPTLSCVQCSLLFWYRVTASSIHSTACWYNSAISVTMNRTCHLTQPFQNPFNSHTVGGAVVTPEEAALFLSLPILHILHLQPAVVLTPILLPAQGHPVHSNFQVFSVYHSCCEPTANAQNYTRLLALTVIWSYTDFKTSACVSCL